MSVDFAALDQLCAALKARLVDPLERVTDGLVTLADLDGVCQHIVESLGELAGTDSGRDFARPVLRALFDDGVPNAAWWRTPLGRLVTRSVPDDLADSRITRAEAAELLDVHVGTVAQLVSRGTLRSEGGHRGLRLGDVLDRLSRLEQRR